MRFQGKEEKHDQHGGKVMIAQNIEAPPTETASYDADYDRQRGGGGFMSFMLFPMISIIAIAYAAFELVR